MSAWTSGAPLWSAANIPSDRSTPTRLAAGRRELASTGRRCHTPGRARGCRPAGASAATVWRRHRDVQPERHDPVHEVVARRDGVEHRRGPRAPSRRPAARCRRSSSPSGARPSLLRSPATRPRSGRSLAGARSLARSRRQLSGLRTFVDCAHDLRSVRAAGLEDGARLDRGGGGEVGQGGGDRHARRGARPRLDLGVRPCAQRAPARARGGVRVLDDRDGDQPAHVAHPARPDGRLQQLPQPGAARQDHVHRRRGVRRPARLGHRRRLVRERVPQLRLRLPEAVGPSAHARGGGADRHEHVDAAGDDVPGPALRGGAPRTATPNRCSSRARRCGSAAAASR